MFQTVEDCVDGNRGPREVAIKILIPLLADFKQRRLLVRNLLLTWRPLGLAMALQRSRPAGHG